MARQSKVKSSPKPKKTLVFDQSGKINNSNQNYANRPFNVSFEVLRGLARNYDIARACINTLKHEVTRIGWHIAPIDKTKPYKESDVIQITELLKRPNPHNETFRTLMDKVVEDLLTIDQIYMEVVRNSYGEVVEIYHIDGATIKPVFTVHGEPKSYNQYIDKSTSTADVVFDPDELLVGMQNPRPEVNAFGYGMSPVESVINTVTNALTANLYNARYFDQSTIPPMLVNFKGKIGKKELEDFSRYWQSMLQGNHFKTAFISSDGAEVTKIRDSNQDMQFMEYTIWLAKVTIAAFEMSPQDIGLTFDINRATGEVQSRLSKSQGLGSIMSLIAEIFTYQLIQDAMGIENLQFEWEKIDIVDELTQARIDDLYLRNGSKTRNEIRQPLGLEPLEDGDSSSSVSPRNPQDISGAEAEKSLKKKYQRIPTLKALRESLYDNWN